MVVRSAVSLALMCLFAPAPVVAADATWEEASQSVRRDPEPEELTRGVHYVRSDEMRHDLFRRDIADTGGIFVGVGTNQNYLMAGWAKPEALVIVDFDQLIVHIHDVYRAIFLNAETPEDLIRLWRPRRESRREVFGHIKATYGTPKRRIAARRALVDFGAKVHKGLTDSLEVMKLHDVPCFLNDQQQYDTVRELFQSGRVLYVRGDFTGHRTMRDIGDLARALDKRVGVLYVSNVEQYIGWGRAYRRNMLSLPLDARTVVLRTYGWGNNRTADGNYRYYVQAGDAFHNWLRARNETYVGGLLRSAQWTPFEGLQRLMNSPQTGPKTAASPAADPEEG